MKVLLDTCIFIWMIENSNQLSNMAREIVIEPNNELLLSSVSVWEMSTKIRKRRLSFSASLSEVVNRSAAAYSLTLIPLSMEAAYLNESLEMLHRDPFDRMLICQAIAGGIPMITPDPVIARYPVKTLW